MIGDRGRPANCSATFVLGQAEGGGAVVFDGRQAAQFMAFVTHNLSFPGTIQNIKIENYRNSIGVTRTDSEKGQRIVPSAGSGGNNAVSGWVL